MSHEANRNQEPLHGLLKFLRPLLVPARISKANDGLPHALHPPSVKFRIVADLNSSTEFIF